MADYQKTMELLKNTSVSYRQIFIDLGITKDQLTRLYNCKVVHVEPCMINCLYDYLMKEHKHRLKQARGCKK
jgi:hypothetical protein